MSAHASVHWLASRLGQGAALVTAPAFMVPSSHAHSPRITRIAHRLAIVHSMLACVASPREWGIPFQGPLLYPDRLRPSLLVHRVASLFWLQEDPIPLLQAPDTVAEPSCKIRVHSNLLQEITERHVRVVWTQNTVRSISSLFLGLPACRLLLLWLGYHSIRCGT